MAKMKHKNWRVRGKSLQLRVHNGMDINGKAVEYTRTISDYNPKTGRRLSDRQRDKEWETFASEVRSGSVQRPSALTVRELCLMHIDQTLGLSPETAKGYRSAVRTHLSGKFGNTRAGAVKKTDVKAWVAYLTNDYKKADGTPLSPKSIRNLFGLVSAAYHTALEEDLLTVNPCANVKLPQRTQTQPQYLNLPDTIRFLRVLDTVPDEAYDKKVAVLLGLMCGLRKGEICGLNVDDIDLDKQLLHVRRARYSRRGGGTYEKIPKTKGSVRTVSIPPSLAADIRHLNAVHAERKLMLANQYADSPALIRGPLGAPIVPNEIYKFLTDILEENDFPHIGVHGLRHTYASTLADLNLDIKTISTQLGHSDVNITDRYIHQFEDKSHDIADAVDELLRKAR